MKRLLVLLLMLVLALPVAAFAQGDLPNPNAQITWPPPVYVAVPDSRDGEPAEHDQLFHRVPSPE
jgi:hypothetical protein